MEIAVDMLEMIPTGWPRIVSLIFAVSFIFILIFLHKKEAEMTEKEKLEETKIVLEIQKLMLEIEMIMKDQLHFTSYTKKNDNLPLLEEKHHAPSPDVNHAFKKQLFSDNTKIGFLGGLSFLFLGVLIDIANEPYKQTPSLIYLVGFIKNFIICMLCGLVAGMIPWGIRWMYFVYGFLLPLIIALTILVFRE